MNHHPPALAASIGLCVGFGCWSVALAAAQGSSDGCGKGPLTPPGTTAVLTLEHGEKQRTARVHLPRDYHPDTPQMLILSVHGYTGSAEFSEREWTAMSDTADRKGGIVVYPQSTSFTSPEGQRITSWNDLACSASPGPEGPTCAADADPYPCPPECGECGACNWCSCHDDVGFIDALLDRLEQTLCVDRQRVFAVGFSNGGMFVQRLGCALSHRFAAVAPWAGTLARGFPCAPPQGAEQPTSLLLLSGTRDRTVPFDGSRSSDGYFYEPNAEVASGWAVAQRCSTTREALTTPVDGTAALHCTQHAECATGAMVADCTWAGEHVWPRRSNSAPGSTAATGQPPSATTENDEFGNELLWWFFERAARTSETPSEAPR